MNEVERLAKEFNRDIALTKAQILRKRFYGRFKETLSRVLEDGLTYTLGVVDRLLIEALSEQIKRKR